MRQGPSAPNGESWPASWGSSCWKASFLAFLRNSIYGFLIELDEDDDVGLQGLLSWLEDGIGFLGVLFVVILPTVALVVTGLTLLGLFLVQRLLEHRERRQWEACAHCDDEQPPCGRRRRCLDGTADGIDFLLVPVTQGNATHAGDLDRAAPFCSSGL